VPHRTCCHLQNLTIAAQRKQFEAPSVLLASVYMKSVKNAARANERICSGRCARISRSLHSQREASFMPASLENPSPGTAFRRLSHHKTVRDKKDGHSGNLIV
jgi:hypothetical protein